MIYALSLCFLLATASLAVAWAATGWVTRWLAGRAILDHPNARSSHSRPTPRGGGLGLLAGLAVGWAGTLLLLPGADPRATGVTLAGAAVLAAVSFVDDLRGLPVALRLAVQVAAVAAALATLPADARVLPGALPLAVDRLATGLAWLWFINLFNFMDGIDGIAGVESLSIALGLTVVARCFGGFGDLGALAIALAGASLGFLSWNWHPAKLFLGDVGSQALGFLIGFLLLRTAGEGAWAAALILPLFYLVDATWTLARRTAAGENIFAAHAQHIYQRAIRAGMSHDQVARAVLIANLALIAFAVGAELGERVVALAGGGLTVLVLIRRLLTPQEPEASGAD